jgi:ATP-dependent RNA helicase DDX49/DBP8
MVPLRAKSPLSEASSKYGSMSSAPEADDVLDDLQLTGAAKRRRISTDSLQEAVSPPPQTPVKSFSRIKKKSSGPPDPKPEAPELIVNAKAKSNPNTFASLNVTPWLLASLSAMAVKRPTAVQQACIPEILKGRDCIGGSRTGSGKTIAFAVPILQKWAEDPTGIFAVVLTPTRELALQIYEQFLAISNPYPLKSLLITGGVDLRDQAIELSKRPHIVIATPGRLADHILNSGSDTITGLRRTRIVVLDEADRLLTSGPGSMLPDVEICLGALPPSTVRQTLLFTATISPEVSALSSLPRPKDRPPIFTFSTLTTDPSHKRGPESSTSVSILPRTLKQTYLLVPTTHRDPYLHVLLSTPLVTPKSTIVFCNRTNTAAHLALTLSSLGHKLTSLHSSLPQSARTTNLASFRSRSSRILVATDLASRGLDIPEVDLVINFDVPRDPDDYVHRVGRTARAGREGTAITLIGQRDVALVHAIEERVNGKMEEWREEGVNVETRVVRDGGRVVKEVSEAGMEAWRILEKKERGRSSKRRGKR